MYKAPNLIAGLLLLILIGASWYIANLPGADLSRIVELQVAVFATFGGLVSAAYVVYSYLQTNRAFIESQRPQLLVSVETIRLKETHESTSDFPATLINYRNITTNEFSELTIRLKVSCDNLIINLDELFTPSMKMGGLDQRRRWFNTYDLLMKKGLDLKVCASSGNTALLHISYTYKYNNVIYSNEFQSYKWDAKSEFWVIA